MSARQESRLQRTARRVGRDPLANGGTDPDDPYGFLAAHRELAAAKQAALTLVAFALELAGTADAPPKDRCLTCRSRAGTKTIVPAPSTS